MATTTTTAPVPDGVSEYGNETHAQFGSAGTRYEFFTSEDIDLTKTFMRGDTIGSTTLAQMKGSGKNAKLSVKPLNSSKYPAEKKEWGNVNWDGTWWGNMTIDSFVNNAKDNMYISYSPETVCLSNKSGTSYKSGLWADMPLMHDDYSDPDVQYWMHDISWGIAPTVYSKTGKNTVLKSKQVQTLYPKTKSPRWHRRAGVQLVESEDYGKRLFFIYTDLLGKFYVYAAYIPKSKKDESGTDTDILEHYKSSNDWAVPTEFYKTATFSWGDAVAPSISNFFGYAPIKTTYINKYGTSFSDWQADFVTNSKFSDDAYDTWMGGNEEEYKDTKNLTVNQYLWTFNYNATKATTITFKKGDVLVFKNIKGDTSNMYKFKGLPFAISEEVKTALHANEFITSKELDKVDLDKICEHYPILNEIDIKIDITGAELKEFEITLTNTSKSSNVTNEYYLSSGYTHPELDPVTKKILLDEQGNQKGNKLSYLWISCTGEIDNYDKDETPYDTTFTKASDPIALDDVPSGFSADADKNFLKLLITGDYESGKETIKAFVDSITGIDDFCKDCKVILKDAVSRLARFKNTLNSPKDQDDSYNWGKNVISGGLFKSRPVILISKGGIYTKNLNVFDVLEGNSDYRTTFALLFRESFCYGYDAVPNSLTAPISYHIPVFWALVYNMYEVGAPETISTKLSDYFVSLKLSPPSTKRITQDWLDLFVPETIFSYTSTVFEYVSKLYNLLNRGLNNPTISSKYFHSNSSFDTWGSYFFDFGDPLKNKTFKTFGSLLKDHVDKSQVLSLLVKDEVLIHRVCMFALVDKIVGDAEYLTSSDIDILKDFYARIPGLRASDISFKNMGAGSTDLTDYFKNIPKLNSQIIDGVLYNNTKYQYLLGYPKDEIVIDSDTKRRIMPYAYIPATDTELFIGVDNNWEGFGKKIKNFKTILNLVVGDTKVKSYLLLDAPYVAITSHASIEGFFGNATYSNGDKSPYAMKVGIPETDQVFESCDMLAAEVESYGMNTYAPHWYMTGWPKGNYPGKYRTNAVTFGLFAKTNEKTFANNIVAVDFGSSSIMFYGAKANYHYDSYDVGSSLYIKNELQESYGVSTDNPPDEIGNLKEMLDIVRFNMLYGIVAGIHTTADIPLLKSFTDEDNLLYDGKDVKAFTTDSRYNAWPWITARDTFNATSFITSHPNGSIAAYSLPPIGFLKAGADNSKITDPYDAAYTIDYVKIAKIPAKPTDTVTFEETTHKKMFNTAFKTALSIPRDYDYYTDPSGFSFAGGFATAGVFYDFNVPNQYKEATNNLMLPDKKA